MFFFFLFICCWFLRFRRPSFDVWKTFKANVSPEIPTDAILFIYFFCQKPSVRFHSIRSNRYCICIRSSRTYIRNTIGGRREQYVWLRGIFKKNNINRIIFRVRTRFLSILQFDANVIVVTIIGIPLNLTSFFTIEVVPDLLFVLKENPFPCWPYQTTTYVWLLLTRYWYRCRRAFLSLHASLVMPLNKIFKNPKRISCLVPVE